MALEIERKFLIKDDFKKDAIKSTSIVQGYLSSDPKRSVRVRIMGEKGYLTIKGIASKSGATRFEFEKEISIEEANDLLKICEPGIIDKTRFLVPAGRHTFEVDVFFGENQGLVLAEVELEHEDEEFIRPDWLGEEVTGQAKYYNSMLKKNPYCNW